MFQKKRRKKMFRTRDVALPRAAGNPYRLVGNQPARKKRVYLIFAFMSVAWALGLILWHPFFQISQIKIQGLERIDKNIFQKYITSWLNSERLYLFTRRTFLLANVGSLAAQAKAEFPIAAISVQKKFPNNLHIVVEEKISTLIYDNGGEYGYVGTDGKVIELLNARVEQATATTSDIIYIPNADALHANFGHYPIVYDSRHRSINIHSSLQ
jgi:cell division septal protein FtsQ